MDVVGHSSGCDDRPQPGRVRCGDLIRSAFARRCPIGGCGPGPADAIAAGRRHAGGGDGGEGCPRHGVGRDFAGIRQFSRPVRACRSRRGDRKPAETAVPGWRHLPPPAGIARVSFRHDGADRGGLSRNHERFSPAGAADSVPLQCDRHLDPPGRGPGSGLLGPSYAPAGALFGRAEGTAGRARQPGPRSRPRASPVRVCEAVGRVARGARGLVPAHCRRNGGRHAIGVGGAGAAMGVLGCRQLGRLSCARAAAARAPADVPVRAGKILDRSAGPAARGPRRAADAVLLPPGLETGGAHRRCST